MSSTIRGVVPPLAIPLKDGELDVPSLERHINRMIDAGLDGLFVSGSTGEVAFSTAERRAQIQREAVRIVDGRIPLLVGVIDTETERVIENIKAVEDIGGAIGVVATAPFYALGGETEVERHFRLLKENTSLELWAYDIPVCVHTKLSPDLLMRLGRDGVIDGVKDSSGDDVAFRWLCRANEAAGHPLQLLTGHEVVVGLTESAAKREGRDVLVAKVPALMSGRFIAENGFKAPGEAKILVDPATHQVLGIHVLGAYAAEMIWGAQAVLEMELTVEDLRQVVFPHPTVSEVIREAAWAVTL
ncbi:dihydrodipicolinate synthase family protein [Actinomyces bouchesdurhonensis]|uniref:dihydrodipicolinate synthase family protein n=1 Tax=Actinomyces bouchesdurhonensis TaxID=1852361 RepID=UPI00093DCEF5|nr:dihydrodipicolinate synthase family protein [Actinomyces bouchesdurhonensis]